MATLNPREVENVPLSLVVSLVRGWGNSTGRRETGTDYSANQWTNHSETVHFCLLKPFSAWYRSDTEHEIWDLMQSKKILNKQIGRKLKAWTWGIFCSELCPWCHAAPSSGSLWPTVQEVQMEEEAAVPGWVGNSLLLEPQQVAFGMCRIMRVSLVCWLDDWWLGSLGRVRVRLVTRKTQARWEGWNFHLNTFPPDPVCLAWGKKRARHWVNHQVI